VGSWELILWAVGITLVEAAYLMTVARLVQVGYLRIALVLYGGAFLALVLLFVALSFFEPSEPDAFALILVPMVLVGVELVRVSVSFGKAKRAAKIDDQEPG